MLSNEQVAEAKRQLIQHVNSNFPEEQRNETIKQIEEMTNEQLEEFLKRNSMLKTDACIFCSIASGKSSSHKIAETDDAVAVLEINPVSRGHTLVLPKSHLAVKEFPASIKTFAQKVAKKLKEKLNPKDVEMASLDFQGHGVINLIPVYTDESIKSERYKAGKEELEEVKDLFKEESKAQQTDEAKETLEEKPQEELTDKNTWLPKRIP